MRTHWLEWELGANLARLGQVEDGGARERVLQASSRRVWSEYVPLRAVSQPAEIFLLEGPSSDINWSLNPASTLRPRTADAGNHEESGGKARRVLAKAAVYAVYAITSLDTGYP